VTTPFSAEDHAWMARALQLAERGLIITSPNPRVGCVIVRDGLVLGEGWTQPAGQNHAEVEALEDAAQRGADVRGATAYVTLEPCSHYGRTPPCAKALIGAGLARVVSAMEDPNPLVAGKGLSMLREAGIATQSGLLADAAHELNIGFFRRMREGRPWVRLKIAASLDGRTALANGESQWITGEAARLDVQRLRARSCTVLTGVGTVLADDPQLNVRAFSTRRQPRRVILDSQLRTPPDAKILRGGALIVCADDASPRAEALRAAGAELLALPGAEGRIDLAALMPVLAQRGTNELLVEAGATLCGAFVAAGLADEIVLYTAPSLLGGDARAMLAMPSPAAMAAVQKLRWFDMRKVGEDLRLTLRA